MGLIYWVVDVLEEAGTKPSSLFHDLFSHTFSMNTDLEESLRAVHPTCPFANISKLSPGGAGSSSQGLLILGVWWALRSAQPQQQCLTKEIGPCILELTEEVLMWGREDVCPWK